MTACGAEQSTQLVNIEPTRETGIFTDSLQALH
jgi:hypothetical protein